jgi:predicted permease
VSGRPADWRRFVPFWRFNTEADIEAELRFHFEHKVADLVARGATPDTARAQAVAEFGDVDAVRSSLREIDGRIATHRQRAEWWESIAQDIGYVVRTLRRSPGFTLAVVLTLALGIGANTAIFGIVNSVLLQPLPYPNANRLVAVFETEGKTGSHAVSRLDLEDWRRQNSSFAHLTAYIRYSTNIVIGGQPERLLSSAATPDFFAVFGTAPLLGTGFPDASSSAVISERLWRSRYSASTDLSAMKVLVSGRPYAIAGVMPESFDFPHTTDVWVPIDLATDTRARSAHNYWIVGDLKPGTSLPAAQADLATVAARIAADNPTENGHVGAKVVDLQESLTGAVKPTLVLLMVMAALVLLIACGNVANLLLVRASGRRREIAVRAALGAERRRLIRQLLTESAVLAFGGALLGVVLAVASARASRAVPLIAALPVPPRIVDPWVLAFTLSLAVGTALVFGLAPALQASHIELVESLKQAGGRTTTSHGLRGALVSAQVALAALLLVGATLTARSILRLQGERLGFDATHLTLLYANPPGTIRDDARRQAVNQLLDRVRALPGVTAAAASDVVPFTGGGSNGGILIEGQPAATGTAQPHAAWRMISDGYFATLRIPLRRGRDFGEIDRGGPRTIIINEAMARLYWPGRDPMGALVAAPGLDEEEYVAHQKGKEIWMTVVGVVGDTRDVGFGLPPQPTIYFPLVQDPNTDATIFVRGSIPTASLRAPLLAAASAVSPEVPARVQALEETMTRSVSTPRFRAFLIGLFAALALTLATIGIYGVAAHVTAQRTSEIGIRMALGARGSQVLWSVVGRVVRYVAIGLALGLAAAAASTRFIAQFLYGITASDLSTYAFVGAVLAFVSLASAYGPARRAARIDPMRALRSE